MKIASAVAITAGLFGTSVCATPVGSTVHRMPKRGFWQGENYVGYSIDVDLNCRKCPSTSCNPVSWYDQFGPIVITCQLNGMSVGENTIWEQTDRGCYVSDNRVRTGFTWIDGVPRCPDLGIPPNGSVPENLTIT